MAAGKSRGTSMMYIRFTLLAIVAVFICSCGRNSNPHRVPSKPFQVIDKYTRVSDFVERAVFRYEGESVFLDGEFEIDRKADQVRIKGRYRSNQELETGVAFAMQSYGLDGELLVRNLPRMAFEINDDGNWMVEFDKIYSFEEMGIDSAREAVLIQFNYVQEGEYWYDIKYPEIELPSVVFHKLTDSERFRTLIAPIPLIAPLGIDCFYPGLIAASKTHDRDFDHRASMQIVVISEGNRLEEARRDIDSSIHLGGDRRLVVARVRFDENGRFLLKHGFVWDAVQWYGDTEDLGGYKMVFVVPLWVYFSSLSLVFGVLLCGWKYTNRLENLVARLAIRVSVWLIALYPIYVSMTNVGFWIIIASGTAYFVAGLRVPISVRLYSVAFLLFSLLEVYWGWAFAPLVVSRSGMLFSICVIAIVLLPVLWIRNSVVSILLIILGTLCSVSIYLLMNLYLKFFYDYPSLRVIGYADQVANVSDSVWSLMGDSHFSSFVIVIWFLSCLLKAHWVDRKRF
jgi:hypothetical protein